MAWEDFVVTSSTELDQRPTMKFRQFISFSGLFHVFFLVWVRRVSQLSTYFARHLTDDVSANLNRTIASRSTHAPPQRVETQKRNSTKQSNRNLDQ